MSKLKTKTKKSKVIKTSLIALIILAGCSYVEPNYEGVLMENYGKAGKADFSLQSGKVWTMAAGTQLYEVPMFEQKGDAPALKVYAKDGGEYTVDPSYTYAPIRGKGIDIIFAYKHLYGSSKEFFDNIENSILNTRVLNAYREESRNFTTDSLMNNVAHYETAVQARLKKEFEAKYFDLQEITSNLIPPQSMRDAIEARNNQIQEAAKIANQKQTRENAIAIEIMNAESEARIKVVTAEGELKSAKLENEARQIRNQSLTNAELERLRIEKWNGVYPTTVAGNGGTFLNIK